MGIVLAAEGQTGLSGLMIAGIVASLVAATTGVLLVIAPAIGWVRRRRSLDDPYEIYYEASEGVVTHETVVEASGDAQQVHLTLKFKATVYVEFVRLQFVGDGAVPEMHGPYDWNWGKGKIPSDIGLHSVTSGAWYWQQRPPLRRYPESRMKIGIEYLARGAFNGNLVVWLTVTERSEPAKELRLPFEVVLGTGATVANEAEQRKK